MKQQYSFIYCIIKPMDGIEPSTIECKPIILPLNYTGMSMDGIEPSTPWFVARRSTNELHEQLLLILYL